MFDERRRYDESEGGEWRDGDKADDHGRCALKMSGLRARRWRHVVESAPFPFHKFLITTDFAQLKAYRSPPLAISLSFPQGESTLPSNIPISTLLGR